MRPEINYGNYVLVRFEHSKPMYAILTASEWGHNGKAMYWQEVARGTFDEVEALAKLMPEPKTLSFD